MSEVDPALHDESQQYGNLDETAAIARLPRNCLVLWLGDHRQTPVFANLRRLDDFDRSCCRPVALRRNSDKGPTKHPISGGSKVPHWYPPLPCLPSGPVDEARSPPPTKCAGTDGDPCQRTTWYICALADGYCPRTALAVLFLWRHSQARSGVDGCPGAGGNCRFAPEAKNWSLILSSSARVSEVTYETTKVRHANPIASSST